MAHRLLGGGDDAVTVDDGRRDERDAVGADMGADELVEVAPFFGCELFGVVDLGEVGECHLILFVCGEGEDDGGGRDGAS